MIDEDELNYINGKIQRGIDFNYYPDNEAAYDSMQQIV